MHFKIVQVLDLCSGLGEGGLLVRISSCQLSAIVRYWPDDTGDHINWTIGGDAGGLMAQDGGIQSWSNTFISSNLSTTLGLVGKGGHSACQGLT